MCAGFIRMGRMIFGQACPPEEEHTARVCEEMRLITEGMGLSREEEHLAQAAALLHDVGRFEQIRKYRTYADPKSVNHGQLGVEILDKEGILNDLSANERAILKTSVHWHSAKTLPEGLDEQTAMFCKLVRDADKLDVLDLLIGNFRRYYDDPEHFDLEVEFSDRPDVSEPVIQSVLNRRLVDYRQIQTCTTPSWSCLAGSMTSTFLRRFGGLSASSIWSRSRRFFRIAPAAAGDRLCFLLCPLPNRRFY